MPTGWRSEYLHELNQLQKSPAVWFQPLAYLEVISNVVPKICARTNSAIVTDRWDRGEITTGDEREKKDAQRSEAAKIRCRGAMGGTNGEALS